ncbi:MAG TPA: trypsin-like peptidase domain-containing protein [Polyangiaceae bacterium]|nr:trypsin-like peptidase domain-containing protein [Polyangiaceae bacterium]
MTTTAAAPAPVAPRVLSPADIAAHALPAVVTIRTEQSLGTGFVVRADGWIATNLHVIVGGPHVKVTLTSRGGAADRELDVIEVLAASPEHDLALVRVEAHGLPVLALGDSDAMRPGDAVVAIGNPLGLEDTVSNGLVSARRKLEAGTEVLQISAPIAPGSSGGPIFNDRGEVIGVATAILQEGQNLNFGMPARYLVPMMKDPEPVPFADFAKLIAQLRQAAGAKTPQRKRPSYPASVLDGCSLDAQKLTFRMLSEAIDTGAPLFNAGKADGCYHVYDGAASDLQRKLPPACRGPAHALSDAQKHAASQNDPTAQAWTMRDAFDALIETIARKQQQAH